MLGSYAGAAKQTGSCGNDVSVGIRGERGDEVGWSRERP